MTARTAEFYNFSAFEFTGYWNGKSRTFKPGERKFMPEYLARHFAKHLANQELTREGKDTATSPKKPEQVPAFMEKFDKAFHLQEGNDGDDDLDVAIDLANREPQKKEGPSSNITTRPNKPIGATTVKPSDELKTKTDPDDDDENYEKGDAAAGAAA